MKNFALFIIIMIAITSCKNVQSQKLADSNLQKKTNSTKVETTPTPTNLLGNLTKKQQKQLEESIPPKVREILDKAEEIEIYVNVDKENKRLKLLMYKTLPNIVAKISNVSLKKQLLESFYYDVALGDGGALCFAPRHRVIAKYGNRSVEFDICYQCKNFEGKSSDGRFSGSLADEDKSALIINEILEKYGTEIQ